VLRLGDQVKKMTQYGNEFSLIGKGLIAFREYPSLIGNILLGASNQDVSWAKDFLGAPMDWGVALYASSLLHPKA